MLRKSGGGTSVEERGPILWIAVAIGAAVVIALVFVRTGDTSENENESTPAAKTVDDIEVDERDNPPPLFDEPGPGTPEPGSQEGRTDAMAELQTDLQGQRLWVELEVEPANESRLVLRSAYCKQDNFKAVINKYRGPLKSNGFSSLACYERHGELIFEDSL
jgi:hypothetical protein